MPWTKDKNFLGLTVSVLFASVSVSVKAHMQCFSLKSYLREALDLKNLACVQAAPIIFRARAKSMKVHPV